MTITRDLEWSDNFSTDIISIDRQHQELLYLSQKLLGILSDDDAGLIDKQAAYHDLADHAVEHFAYEERVMRNIRYPDLPRHIREHDELRREIGVMTEQVDRGEGMDGWKGLASMVQVWVLRHIVASDTRLREHIQRDDEDEEGLPTPEGGA